HALTELLHIRALGFLNRKPPEFDFRHVTHQRLVDELLVNPGPRHFSRRLCLWRCLSLRLRLWRWLGLWVGLWLFAVLGIRYRERHGGEYNHDLQFVGY